MRDDFANPTKDMLARRAGSRCSNPDCRKLTSGPHTDPKKAINIGVAAHITAASALGPRYDSSLSPEERASIENGIWLCQSCAKLVDNDESTFTPVLLRSWRDQHEQESMKELRTGMLTDRVLGTQCEGRDRLIAQVRADCTNAIRDWSIYDVPRIELGMKSQPGAVVRGLDDLVQRAGAEARELAAGTRLSEVFDEQLGQLLVLGGQGSGKTRLLLELANDLVERAANEPDVPVPVVFLLSAWVLDSESLDRWMTEELQKRTEVPKHLARQWVMEQRILPLLDGLDEVPEAQRQACVDAINAHRQEHGWLQMVVSSRIDEYEKLSTKLRLRAALVVQPLSGPKVQQYLSDANDKLLGLRQALGNDPSLLELLETPLMLSVAAMAYEDQTMGDVQLSLRQASLDGRRKALFQAYFNAMFTRRSPKSQYSRDHTLHWLKWLASSMIRSNTSIFRPASLNRDTLVTAFQRLLTNLIAGAIYGLAFGLINWMGVMNWLILVCTGAIDWLILTFPAIAPNQPYTLYWMGTVSRLIGYRIVGPANELVSWLTCGLLYGVMVGLTNELVRWVKRKALDRIGVSPVFGGLVAGAYGLAVMMIGLGIGWLFGSALFFLISGVVFWGMMLLSWVVVAILIRLRTIRRWKVTYRVVIIDSLVIGDAGPFDSAWPTRFVLWLWGYAPISYGRFLDFATERIFLRKVGNGYIFWHKMLMEYFHSLGNR